MSIINNMFLLPFSEDIPSLNRYVLFNQHIPGARILKQNNGTQGLDYKADTGCP
jgi:hypothetical protein